MRRVIVGFEFSVSPSLGRFGNDPSQLSSSLFDDVSGCSACQLCEMAQHAAIQAAKGWLLTGDNSKIIQTICLRLSVMLLAMRLVLSSRLNRNITL
jgi:hypothetical protein